ncbi:DHA2 family efflux MFS transporter permease subunit [Uliginosibacterium sp. H3]|uniref:DHA2 family efflux MFS transporter permease subunit n=1 Tax=Uliginosibacterium silvisoli TaxID=3114758 RepID=A0ABU6K1P7_9RHOO|nr:DHA2 family efflux MFS transporter permease subunit [Uliginosibacterium sp. H3]
MAEPQAPAPLEGSQRMLATLALSLATFMNVLDTSIANVSLPAIAGDMGVAPNQGTWVITSFAVANAVSVPLTGWLTQRFGQVRLFVASVILFTIASFLCGVATTLPMLIAFRILQGAVAGPMIPLSQSLLLSSYPKSMSGTAFAAWSMTTLIAPVMGPLLGGWISDNFSWPWIFYVNIPAGILASWVVWRIFKTRETPTRKLPIDMIGLGLLVVWVSCLQLTLDKGKELDWFNSGEIVALAATALVGFCFFIVWERGEEHPVVDLSLFKLRNFTVATIAISLGYGVFFGSVVLMPLWLQQFMAYTSTWAGLTTAPVGLFAIIASPIVGKNMHRWDARKVASAAFVIFALVSWMRSEFNTQADYWTLILPQLVQGFAMACFFIPLVSITLSQVKPHLIPSASGLSSFVRITCGALGASIFTTMWESRASLHHAQLAESVSNLRPESVMALNQLQASGMSEAQSLGVLDRLVTVQAYTLSADELFLASAIIFLVLTGIVWFAKPVKPSGVAAPAGGDH